MKGLQQAVNIKLWPGNGESAKPWGKLKQDPKLWDEHGDTLIYFGRGRPDPSFRIRSNLLRDIKSANLMDMLYKGTVLAKNQTMRGVNYKLYMEPPSAGSKIDILRHHITTRNFFAFLLHESLVGFTFYQALVDLHERLEEYLPPTVDCAAALGSYLVTVGLVNVCNEPRAAAGLLAWSEDVRWNEGWREAFVHSAGMYAQLSQLQESADISLPTKAHLDRAHLELQVRIQEAEDSLSIFYFDDAHFAQDDMSPTIRATSDRFRKFLKQFYEKEYQNWPIRRAQPGLWLDRIIISRLQQDFSALYEYGVDRNVLWNNSDELDDRRKKNLLKSVNTPNFGLDGEDVRMLGVFQNLDCRLNTSSHIPHPYPLLPTSVPTPARMKKSVFSGKKKDKVRESRVAHAYVEASNASLLIREFAQNELVEAFVRFEKTDLPGEVDPREARRERWIIIYCILQTLAGLSVDVPNLSFKGDVSYFLNTRLQGLPPWSPSEKTYLDASREDSHCWTNPQTWADGHFERWGSTKSPRTYVTKSEGSHSSRPLSPEPQSYQSYPMSPESQSSSFAFFDSNRPAPPSEFEPNESCYRDSAYDSSITELSTSPDRGVSPQFRVPSKFAATAGIPQYSVKPLPLRPVLETNQDQKTRRPKR